MLATPLPIKRHVTIGLPPVSLPGRVAATIPQPKPDKKAKSILKVKGEDEDEDTDAEPETFSDVDDEEIDNYIHTAEEVKLRRVIWSELNRDYSNTGCEGSGRRGVPPRAGDRGDGGKGGKKKIHAPSPGGPPQRQAADARARRSLEDQLRRAERPVQAGRVGERRRRWGRPK